MPTRCSQCGFPTTQRIWLQDYGYLCHVCVDMFLIAANSDFMVANHAEYMVEQRRKERLLPGAD